ncbi:hypothetical protein, partial [Myxococcus xanthus]|uniref:hypothetical protein n=1 Tax=Myxococcus xanthus TaxID=34 RepID=UPI001C108482
MNRVETVPPARFSGVTAAETLVYFRSPAARQAELDATIIDDFILHMWEFFTRQRPSCRNGLPDRTIPRYAGA